MQEVCVEALRLTPHDKRAEAVSACGDGGCVCEQYSVSEYSPHPVTDEETLHLLVKDPNHLLADGQLHPGLFAGIFTRGLSVLRGNAEAVEFERTAVLLSGQPGEGNYLHGVANFSAGSVRNVDGERFMTVFDTGYDGREHHADVFQPNPSKLSNSAKMKRQKALRALVSADYSRILTFRDGILAAYERPAEVVAD